MPYTARPDVWAKVEGKTHPAHSPVCPGCLRKLLGLFLTREHYTLVTCDGARRGPKHNCRQHAMVVPLPGDLVNVYPLTTEQFQQLAFGQRTARESLDLIGASTAPERIAS